MGVPRIAGTLFAGLVVVGLLPACDAAGGDDGPDPDKAAAALASALTTGDFAGVSFTDESTEAVSAAYAELVEGMGDVEPAVEVGDVEESDDVATAALAWAWPLGEQEWSYQTDAALRLVDDEWQVVWTPTVVEPSLTGKEVLESDPIAPERAGITGAGGLALVAERPVVRFGIDRTMVEDQRAGESARRLAELLDIDVASYVKQVEAAGDEAFIEGIVYRRDDVPPQVAQGYHDIDGVLALAGELPLAPTREFAAPILGSVGEVTAEMIEEDPDRYAAGDQAGLSGLQARYDDQLGGTRGVVVDAVRPNDKERELFREEPVAGQPLALTIDVDLQLTAERLLADVGPASALVAMRPSNGNILVAANGPGADGYNMATFGQFAPGSTFKSVSSLALLRAGLTPDSVVPCTSQIVVDGKQFENYDDYPAGGLGRIPLRTAVANSCNTAIISQAGKLTRDSLVDAAASLGMGVDHDVGFPAYFGSVTPPASETEAAANLIGQGKVLASPMTMATVIASIQSGDLVVPRMVTSVDVAPPDGVEPPTRDEVAALRGMLRAVVTSGSGSTLADVPGPPVIAKTGTAEFVRNGDLLTHAWMIAAQGDLAVAVFVEVGDSGSGTAGPILESFLRDSR